MSFEDRLGPRKSSELLAARAAVAASLEDEDTAALFGEPVDPGVLPDYLDIIKEPKDLGTVLADIDKSIKGAGPYRDAKDVFRDVQLIWSNCRRYNNRPEDKPIVEICRHSSDWFNEEWRKAGLVVPSSVSTSAKRTGKELLSTPAGTDKGTLDVSIRRVFHSGWRSSKERKIASRRYTVLGCHVTCWHCVSLNFFIDISTRIHMLPSISIQVANPCPSASLQILRSGERFPTL
jgi:hypothetical protein